MSYINFCTVTIFLYLLMTVQSEILTWLMLGEKFAKDEVSPEIGLTSEELFFPVSTLDIFEIKAKEGRIITSLIAASIHMQGYVSVLTGGINQTSIEKLGEPTRITSFLFRELHLLTDADHAVHQF
ncbi:hypothetical protein KM043_005193 [Ampulex compressa]|nr:hypothetical protein KM043_005193 [Ampulex compressa]